MNALPHLLLGLAVAAAAAGLFAPGIEFSLSAVAIASLGALAPDVDHRKTKLFKAVLLAVFGCVAAIAFQITMRDYNAVESTVIALGAGITAVALAFLLKPRHRGFTHSLAALALFTLAAYLAMGWESALLGGSAYASHLLADNVIKPF